MSLIACCNGQQVLRSTCGTPRKRQSKCRETCGSTRKRQSKYRETCGTPANAKANAERLAGVPANVKANAGRPAGLPQTPKQMLRDLRDTPQTPKSSSRHLQQCCRYFQKRFGRASVETLCGLYSYTKLTLNRDHFIALPAVSSPAGRLAAIKNGFTFAP